MVIRYGICLAVLSLLAFGCKEEKPPEWNEETGFRAHSVNK